MLKNYIVKSLRERKPASLGKWILYITIVFFFIYDCYFLHFSLTSNLILTIFGFFIFFLTAFANKEKRIHDNTLFGIILVLLMFLYALSVQVINSTSGVRQANGILSAVNSYAGRNKGYTHYINAN